MLQNLDYWGACLLHWLGLLQRGEKEHFGPMLKFNQWGFSEGEGCQHKQPFSQDEAADRLAWPAQALTWRQPGGGGPTRAPETGRCDKIASHAACCSNKTPAYNKSHSLTVINCTPDPIRTGFFSRSLTVCSCRGTGSKT